MKRKIMGILMTAILITTGTIDIAASELVTEETEFSDGDSNDLDDSMEVFSDSEKVEDFEIIDNADDTKKAENENDVPAAFTLNGYETNKIELNKYYNMNNLISAWGYLLELNIPEDGRIKIKIEDCNVDKIELYGYYIPDDGSSSSYYDTREWEEIGVENLDSGWITVQKGIYIPKFYHKGGYDQTFNREAKLIVEYQKKGDFYGESEPNSKFDDATFMQNNITYEGNYSKYDDFDCYKFCMDKPGKAKIIVNNKSSYTPYYRLYEEDENGNVYEIENKNLSGMRLGSGNYYIGINPNRYRGENTYTVCVNVDYESSDIYEQEPNNVKSAANDKQINTWYTGNLNTKEDVDYYKFVIDKPGKIKLELKVPRESTGNVLATLYDENLKKIENLQSTSNPYIETKEQKYPEGIYYIRVENGDERNFFGSDYSICLNQEEYKYVKQIILPDSLSLNTGEKYTLTPQILPPDAENPELTWSSSDNSVVSVNSNGVINAKCDGEVTITAKASDGSGIESSVKVSVKTVKTDISNADIVLDDSYPYNGKDIKPDFSIILGNKGLIKNRDYTVSYKNNSQIGTASIIVTGIGNYTGTLKESFNIIPQNVKITSVKTAGQKKLKVSWKKVPGVDGYILYRSTSKTNGYKAIKTIKNSNATSYTNGSLKDGKKYYYEIRAYKKTRNKIIFYSEYSAPKYATTLKVNKKANVVGTYSGSATITVYKSNNVYYARAYGRGGRMNTVVRLYAYSDGYRAYYSNSDVFFTISNISSKGAKIIFPYVSEFNGWYSK